jgi:F0F1-type ATP synthase epsilon subunit
MTEEPNTPVLSVKIIAPTRKLFEGSAVSVTAANKVGMFDVLVDHANFFSILTPSDVIVDTGNGKITFPVSQGLIKVKNNVVTLFVDIQSAYFS